MEPRDVLSQILRTAAELTGAPYAALAVHAHGGDGRLEETITHGLPPGPPPTQTVPVRIGDEVLGELLLTGSELSGTEEAVIGALASAAAVVIQNDRLYAEAARRQRWLEAAAEITSLLVGHADRDEALQVVADRARELADADVSTVALRTSETDLEILVMSGQAGAQLPIRLPVDGSLAGRVVTSGEPLLIDDVREDPRARIGVASVRPETLGATVMLPLRTRNGVDGVLGLAWRPERAAAYRAVDVALPAAFAEQAALALDLAHTRVNQARMTLFEDRDRIGRDLHDLVIQRLFAIGLTLDSTARSTADPEVGARLTRAVDEIDATIKDIRRTIFELTAPVESADLRARVVRLVEESVVTLGFRPTLTISGPVASVIDEGTGTALLAVLRESLSNVARHARATAVEILLVVSDRVLLSVTDDGIGISPEQVAMGGVQNMRERAERLGGSFILGSQGHGTTLTWTAPLQPAE